MLLLLGCAFNALATVPAKFWQPTYFDETAGLSLHAVTAVHVDNDNYVWIGTERGLLRFDGHRFINFSKLVHEIPEDVVLGIDSDSMGRIVVNWYRNTIQILYPDQLRAISIPAHETAPGDLVNISSSFATDESGNLWLSGRRAVYRVDQQGNSTPMISGGGNTSSPVMLDRHVLVGTFGGIQIFNTRTGQSHVSTLPAGTPGSNLATRILWNREIGEDRVVICAGAAIYFFDLHRDSYQTIDVLPGDTPLRCLLDETRLIVNWNDSDRGQRLHTYNLVSGQRVDNRLNLPESGDLIQLFKDSHGNTWFAMNRALWVSTIGRPLEQVATKAPLFNRRDLFAETRDGVVLVATDGAGLMSLSPRANKFRTVKPPSRVSSSKAFQPRRMTVDLNDNLWVGSDANDIAFWDRKNDTWKSYDLGGKQVSEIMSMPDGSVWALVPQIGRLVRYAPATDRFEKQNILPAGTSVMGLGQGADGRLIIVTRNMVYLYDTESGQLERRTLDYVLPRRTRAVKTDQSQHVWLGVQNDGLLRIDTSGRTRKWSKSDSELTSNDIYDLHFDSKNNLWIGTWGGGLLRMDLQTESFEHFGVESGLPGETVFGILADETGPLWLSTYAGLARFTPCDSAFPCKPRIQKFDHFDGLQGMEFDAEAAYQSRIGEMFFGGINGINAFFPDHILASLETREAEITITRALLDGEPLPGAASELSIPEQIRLPHDFEALAVELSTLDYSYPDRIRFQVRRNGPKGQWEDLDEASLTFRGMPEGDNWLEFRANPDGAAWSNASASLAIRVNPPLYRHPLALLIYVAATILLTLAYARKRQVSLQQQKNKLQSEVTQRTHDLEMAITAREEFFANISHEISAPVHMILMMLEQNLDRKQTESKALLQSATGYAAQLLAYLRQLVREARTREFDNTVYRTHLSIYLRQLTELNQPIAHARNIKLTLDALPDREVRVYACSAPHIFSNLLCNALTYTPEGGEVRVSGEVVDEQYRVLIRNTAPEGMNIDFGKSERNNFDPTRHGGHGLGLSIVTSAVETLDGHVTRTIEENGWVVFEVSLPLAQAELPELRQEHLIGISREQRLAVELISNNRKPARKTTLNPGKVRLLIVEDDQNVAQVLHDALSAEFHVLSAETCSDAIRMLNKHAPEVVLCDLFLPDQSGFEVVRAARKNRMTEDAFVVMVTASISETDRKKALRLGVDQFLNKPVSTETLRLIISGHAALDKQRQKHRDAAALGKKAQTDRLFNTSEDFKAAMLTALDELHTNPQTSIADMQMRMSLSYNALVSKCKLAFGKTPKRLLIEKRVESAKRLLRESDAGIGMIADLSGFASHPQFTVTFRKETGQTPAEFRNGRKT